VTQPEPSPPNGSDLCVACGLCCTGLLFDIAPLEDHEVPLAEALRLPVVRTPVYEAFRLPCPRQEGTVCGVYKCRPAVCGSYECGLLRRFVAGEVPLEDALARVAGIQERAAELRGRVPSGPRPRPLWDDAHAYLQRGDETEEVWRRERDEITKALAELRAACRRDLDP
jgi:hypothetical protein